MASSENRPRDRSLNLSRYGLCRFWQVKLAALLVLPVPLC
jgi:hypothetical protein